MQHGGKYLLGRNNECYLDFYLYEQLQVLDFLTSGKVFEDYPSFEGIKNLVN